VCTNDSCGGGGCLHANNSVACDDGDMCNGTDTCSGGACRTHSGGLANETRCGLVQQRCCGGVCVDTRFDENNCGFCGNVCPTAGCTLQPVGGDVAGTCFCDAPSACPTGFDCDATQSACACRTLASCGMGQSCAAGSNLDVCVY
jgi:hypothetical protein